jgi:putative SOS response-associated peptidase YedK
MRFSLYEISRVKHRWDITLPKVEPNYNIYPGSKALVVVPGSDSGVIMRYGLSSGISSVSPETILNSSELASRLLSFRCIIPADGFYETVSGVTFRHILRDELLFSIAGIFDGTGFAMICVDGKPLVLRPEHEWVWVSTVPIAKVFKMMYSGHYYGFDMYPVSSLVESSLNSAILVRPDV